MENAKLGNALTAERAQQMLDEFLQDRDHRGRYASFDYCYGHFQKYWQEKRVSELCGTKNIRQSCTELGFYLASWGMLRGSSDLLNKSSYFLKPVIEAIASAPSYVWELDVAAYDTKTWTVLKQEKMRLTNALGNLRNRCSHILLTKIMMGVYGNVPAFDQYFTTGLGVYTFGPKSVSLIRDFYKTHEGWLGKRKIRLLSFDDSENETVYPKAKLIDMIFFMKGLKESKKRRFNNY